MKTSDLIVSLANAIKENGDQEVSFVFRQRLGSFGQGQSPIIDLSLDDIVPLHSRLDIFLGFVDRNSLIREDQLLSIKQFLDGYPQR